MLRSIRELRGYIIRAIDGEIGKVHEFFFDDRSWLIRYLVVDTGSWLPGRQVLISPYALGQPDWTRQTLPVELTRGQIENSPPISADKPVSRQMEQELHTYYGWSPYWRAGASNLGLGAVAVAHMISHTKEKEDESGGVQDDSHLRSSREVVGYHIQATDGEIGHVEDFVADDEHWAIHYMVVDTHNWLPGRKVLVSPAWIDKVKWIEKQVHVDLRQETVRKSPEFDPSTPVNREYEIRLYDYYGRPKYWTQS